jgi:hypothetical protein
MADLTGRINSGTVIGKINTGLGIGNINQSNFNTEVQQRISGEESLTTVILTQDNELRTLVSGETLNRVLGDSSLLTVISTETSSRISGDTSLSTVISGYGNMTGYNIWVGTATDYASISSPISTTLYYITA